MNAIDQARIEGRLKIEGARPRVAKRKAAAIIKSRHRRKGRYCTRAEFRRLQAIKHGEKA